MHSEQSPLGIEEIPDLKINQSLNRITAEAMGEQNKTCQPIRKEGNLQLNEGKPDIKTDKGVIPYDALYVASLMEKTLHANCTPGSHNHRTIQKWISELKEHGAAILDTLTVQIREKRSGGGTSLIYKHMDYWIQTIKQIKYAEMQKPQKKEAEMVAEPQADNLKAQSVEEIVGATVQENSTKTIKDLKAGREAAEKEKIPEPSQPPPLQPTVTIPKLPLKLKMWGQLAADEKIERLRTLVKSQGQELDHLHQKTREQDRDLMKFEKHVHGKDAQLYIPYKREFRGGYGVTAPNNPDKSDDKVFI